MAEDQIIVEIKVEAGELDKAKKDVDKLTGSIEELTNSISATKKQNNDLKKQQQELNKQYKDGTISTKKYEKGIDEINVKIKTNNKSIAETQIQLSKEKGERNNLIKFLDAEGDSRNQLRQKISLLTKEYNSLNLSTEEGKARSKELATQLNTLSTELNKGSLASGNFKDNIGNYPELFENAVGGVKNLGAQFLKLATNPVVLVISLIAILLKGLFDAFKKSASGSEFLTKAGLVLEGVLKAVVSIVEPMAKLLLNAFKDPKQAVLDLWEAIKTNIVNRITGIANLFVSLGNVIKNSLSFDFDEAKAALGDLSTALIQVTTGFDKQQQDDFINGIKDAAAAAEDLTRMLLALDDAQRLAQINARVLKISIAQLSAELDLLNSIADDGTKSFKDREKAAEDARLASEKLFKKQIQLAQEALSLINQEVSIRKIAGEDIRDVLDKQSEAQIALIEAEKNYTIKLRENEKQRAELMQDRLEKDLDIFLDGFDNQKTINEKIINNEKKTFDERRALLNETTRLSDSTFANQVSTIQQFTKVAINENDLLATSDAKMLQEKIRALGLSEIIEGRLLEVIRERRTVISDLNELDTQLTLSEVERKKAANEKIASLNDERKLRGLKLASDIRDAELEIEQRKFEKLLQQENLLAEERLAIQTEYLNNIDIINKEFQEKDVERTNEIIETQFAVLTEAAKEFTEGQDAIFINLSKNLVKIANDNKATWKDSFEALGQAANQLSKFIIAGQNNGRDNLKKSKEAELAIAGDDIEKKTAIEKEYRAKEADLLRKEFVQKKAAAIIDIAINTAIAATKAAPNPALIALTIALGLFSAGIVLSKQPPAITTDQVFQSGGTIVKGASHAAGGVDIFGNNGQYFGNVEGGEMMTVLKKDATDALRLSNMNEKFGGRSFFSGAVTKAADGGTLQTQNQVSFTPEEFSKAIEKTQIIVMVEDIASGLESKRVVVKNGNI